MENLEQSATENVFKVIEYTRRHNTGGEFSFLTGQTACHTNMLVQKPDGFAMSRLWTQPFDLRYFARPVYRCLAFSPLWIRHLSRINGLSFPAYCHEKFS